MREKSAFSKRQPTGQALPVFGYSASGWQRQAESLELGDGGFPVRRTIVKAKGLGDATRTPASGYPTINSPAHRLCLRLRDVSGTLTARVSVP